MKLHRYARPALGAAFVAVTLALSPGVASAAPAGDPAKLDAVTEREANGNRMSYPVGRGEVVPAAIGVTNLGAEPVDGLVVELKVLNDLDMTGKYRNCWYAVDSNAESAFCEFDVELAPGATLALAGPVVATSPNASPERVTSIMFRWMSRAYADQRGGAQAMADATAQDGKAIRGTEGALALESRTLPPSADLAPLSFAYARLTVPSTTPTATPTSPSAAPSASAGSGAPAPGGGSGGGAGDDDGGLPVTGAQTAVVAGLGGALLLLGAAGYVVARRRRTRFVA